MLKVNRVKFSYRNRTVFDDLSMCLVPNKITTIIGPNGTGKSTLFKLLSRVEKPISGQVSLNGQDIWKMDGKEFAKKVAILHQQNEIYDEMTVLELVKMGRMPYSSLVTSQNVDQDKLDEIFKYLDLDQFKDKLVSELSGGQRQRVWLATALAQEPEILLLDEPTTYLDLHFQYKFLKLLQKLNHDQNLTICMVLHDLNQALEFSDQIILLNNGKIEEVGKPEEVITEENVRKTFEIDCQIIKTEDGMFLRQF